MIDFMSLHCYILKRMLITLLFSIQVSSFVVCHEPCIGLSAGWVFGWKPPNRTEPNSNRLKKFVTGWVKIFRDTQPV